MVENMVQITIKSVNHDWIKGSSCSPCPSIRMLLLSVRVRQSSTLHRLVATHQALGWDESFVQLRALRLRVDHELRNAWLGRPRLGARLASETSIYGHPDTTCLGLP